jgi:hypothetical protein
MENTSVDTLDAEFCEFLNAASTAFADARLQSSDRHRVFQYWKAQLEEFAKSPSAKIPSSNPHDPSTFTQGTANTSEITTDESMNSIFTNLSKTIEDGKKETVQCLIVHILQRIKEKSMLGKSDDCLYLTDYDYEDYSDADFDTIVKGIQNELYKFNVKITGGWSTKFRSLYIYIQWNKKWKNYWFFGTRHYYG